MSQVSTKHLLEFTPKGAEMFGSCKLRQATTSHGGIQELPGKDCSSSLQVVRYLSNTDFCLRVGFPRQQGLISYKEVAFDPSAPGIVQSITLNHTLFAKVASFKVFFTLGNSTGYKELETAPRIDRGYNYDDNSTFYNHFGIRYHVVSSYFAYSPSPFSPFSLEQLTENNVNEFPHGSCKDGISKEDVLADCVEKETKDLFKTHSPMTIVFSKDADERKILSESILDGPFETRAWKQIVSKCEEKSDLIKECKDVRVVTTVDERIAGKNFTLVELVPADASFDLTHNPQTDLISFLLKICAILSTGFGFSLFTWMGCRWTRYAKHDPCCWFGFKGKIEDPQAKRVTKLESDMEQSKKEAATLRADLQRTTEILDSFVETVDPIRTDIRTLEVDVGQLKQNAFSRR